MRGFVVKQDLKKACIVSVVLEFPKLGKHSIDGVMAGKTVILLVSEVPLQTSISTHRREVLAVIQSSFPEISTVRLYAETYR